VLESAAVGERRQPGTDDTYRRAAH